MPFSIADWEWNAGNALLPGHVMPKRLLTIDTACRCMS